MYFGAGFIELFDNECFVNIICDYLFYNLLFCFLLSSSNLYEFILLIRCLMAACFCAGGWQESCGMITSVAVGLRYILNSSLFPSFWIQISRKLMLLSVSFSIVNFIVGLNSLNAA